MTIAGLRRFASGGRVACTPSSSPLAAVGASLLAGPALTTATRGRFYRPLVNQGINLWRRRMGRIHAGWNTWEYQHTRPDPRPYPEPAVNDYYGRSRLWNPIAGKIGFVKKKAEEWGWPHQRPPPTGLRRSQEFFPYFFARYFPDVEVRLLLDSVLNNETTRPVFLIPCDMSRVELANYLKNIYGVDNIVRIQVRNMRGRRYKNEVGEIKAMDDYKVAVVELDSPVSVEFKQIKGTEDTPDNKSQARISG
ncbi:Ribosomal protein L25/L23 [Trypanosoma melophagium]|uniref:Ribosomal protein L25/L23 n=1 Tax=Trypanosoma melophagium TaxID=715481 RepID=UPI00351A87C6|nr:Ribosomal protein L25/L23 [Trypanosoma melophagium]